MKTLHLGIITILFSVSLLLVTPSVHAADPTDSVTIKAGDSILYTFGSEHATDITFVNAQEGGSFTKAYFMLTVDNQEYKGDIVVSHDNRSFKSGYWQKLPDADGTFTVKIHVPADADPDAIRHVTIFGEEAVDPSDCGGNTGCIINPVLAKLEINVKSADKIIEMDHRFYTESQSRQVPNTVVHPGESVIVIVSDVPDRFSHNSFISPLHSAVTEYLDGTHTYNIISQDPHFVAGRHPHFTYNSNPDGNFVVYFEIRSSVQPSFIFYINGSERTDGMLVSDPVALWNIFITIDPKPVPQGSPIFDTIQGGSVQGYGVPEQPQEPEPTPTVDPALVESVKALAAQTYHGEQHVDRWNRVLAAFGVLEHNNPMTAAEAQLNTKRHSSPVWVEVAEVLRALEAAQ